MISVIAPVFKESATLIQFYYQLRDVMVIIGAPYEIILVDNGSTGD